MELVVITSHVPEGIPSSLTPSLVSALQARGRAVHHLSTLPDEDEPGEAGTFGVLGTPLEPLLQHRGPAVTRCFYVLPADPRALRSLPSVEARVQAARFAGVRFRVHHWILTEQEPTGLVQMFEAVCAPVRPDWVLSPWTDGQRWAQQVADDLVRPETPPPAADFYTNHTVLSRPRTVKPLENHVSSARRPSAALRRVSDRLAGTVGPVVSAALRWVSDRLAGTVGLVVTLIILAVVASVLLFVGLGGRN